MVMSLEGKIALVTGAARGIGRAIALELARAGAHVVVNYAGSEQAAREVVAEVEGLGQQALAIQANVADADSVQAMIKQVLDTFGRLDILVNNAGITKDNLLMRMKDEEWEDVINVNLKGVYHCIKAVSRQMMKQRAGRIINISSVVGVLGNAGQANYVAAKAGVIGLTKTVAREFASRGITVNAVAPGFISTDMTAKLSEEIREELLKQIPLGQLGQPEHIAKAVRFLASDDAAYMTGQTLHVDGGMVMP
jgi:3-oxoacyl-[acyl-carrier protein] reductase